MSQTYQSRIFSFISSRTNQLKDTCAKGWRHLKVKVVWTGQILLHPLQILAQATKILQPQLPPSAQPTPDLNIEEALSLVETAGYPIEIAIPTPPLVANPPYQSPQPPKTNFISTAARVFKGRQSLTLQQGNDDRLVVNDRLFDLSTLNTNNDRQIDYTPLKPIIRGLSSLLSDRQIVLVTTENELINTLTIPQQQQIRRRIGMDLATTWERWQTSTINPQQPTQILPDRSQLYLSSESNPPSESLLDRFNNWLYNFSRQPEPENSVIQPKPSSSENNIPQLLPSIYPETFPISITTPLQNRSFFLEDRWLDLPQLPPIMDTNLDPPPKSTNMLTKFQPNWLKQWVSYYQDYLYIPDTNHEIIQVGEFKLTPIEPEYDTMKADPKIRQLRSGAVSSKLAVKPNRDLEYHPDWIDTTVEDIGYDRPILSQILTWLDRVVASIENWIIKIWNAIIDRRGSIDR
jgi:hypothetical protein